MSDTVHEKVQKLFESRAKAEADLNKIQREVTEAVNNAERRVRIERLVTYCEEAMTKAFSKNEQLLELAKKTSNPAFVKADLEKWLNDTTVQNDEILRSAREYIDQCPNVERVSQSSAKTSKKVKSSKASSSKVSKSSSQRQRELLIAQHKREEIERQNEAALRLAKQKQELELEQLQEENRKRLAEAHLVELELQDDISETNEDLHETLSRLSSTSATNENQRINEWINNSPVVTINNNQPQTVVSMGIATSIATTTAVTSSLPPLSNADPTTMTSDGTNQVSPRTPLTSVTTIPVAPAPVSNVHPIPVTSGGTVYYVPPSTLSTPIAHTTQPTTSLSPTAATFVPTGTTSVLQPSTTGFSIQDLALLLASTKKDHLPEWKLAQYSGDPLQ